MPIASFCKLWSCDFCKLDHRHDHCIQLLMDLNTLQFKQRDELENVFKTWAEEVPFDMATLRDYRLRHNYADRYDFRVNLIDWDYQMVLKKHVGAIHTLQYRGWRNTGVAFEYGDQTYDKPNRSLASYVEGRERGRSTMRRGFWGDTVVSPFHAVGTAAYVPTDAEAAAAKVVETLAASAASVSTVGAPGSSGRGSGSSGSISISSKPKPADGNDERDSGDNYAWQLFDIMSRHSGSEQWRHHTVELATYNLVSWLFEIETAHQYVMHVPHDIYSGLADAVNWTTAAGAAAADGRGPGVAQSPVAAAAGTAATSPAAAAGDDANGGTGAAPGIATTSSAAPAPSRAATSAAAAAPNLSVEMQAAARAAATARARTIARAFRGITVTLLTGEFDEFLTKNKLAGRSVTLATLLPVGILLRPVAGHLQNLPRGLTTCLCASDFVTIVACVAGSTLCCALGAPCIIWLRPSLQVFCRLRAPSSSPKRLATL